MRNYLIRYTLSFVLLCSFISLIVIIVIYDERTHVEYGHTTDVAGRQRMLTQRLANYSNQLVACGYVSCDQKTKEKLISQIRKAKILFLDSFLLLNSSKENNQKFIKFDKKIYDFAGINQEEFSLKVKHFVETTDIIMSSDFTARRRATNELNKLSEPLLTELDLLVEAFTTEASDTASNLTWVQYSMIFLLAIGIPVTVIRMLRPMEKDLRKSVANLEKQKDFMNRIVGLMPDPLLIVNAKGEIHLTNKAAEKMFGWSEENLTNMNISDLLSPPGREHHRESIQNFVDKPDVAENRALIQSRPVTANTKSGKEIKITVSLARFDAPERKLGIAIIRDMSMLENLNDALEKNLAATRFAKETKDRFIRNISHELRTPLNAVIGFSELLKMNLKLEGNLEYIAYVNEAGNQLLEKINQLIEAASHDQEKVGFNITKVSLAEYVNEMKTSWSERMQDNKRSLEVKDFSSDLLVNIDREVLSHVVDVILDNVNVHCPEGTAVKIYMDEESDVPCLTIEDNGDGIGAKHLSRIGSPFEKESDGLTAQNGGLALSLFLAKRQIEAIRGRIKFFSEVGRGFKVNLYLQAAAT